MSEPNKTNDVNELMAGLQLGLPLPSLSLPVVFATTSSHAEPAIDVEWFVLSILDENKHEQV